jgi:hypothetical protein
VQWYFCGFARWCWVAVAFGELTGTFFFTRFGMKLSRLLPHGRRFSNIGPFRTSEEEERIFSVPSQKGKRLDDSDSLLQQFVLWTGVYQPRTRLPLLTRTCQPARFPMLGIAGLIGVNIAVNSWWVSTKDVGSR